MAMKYSTCISPSFTTFSYQGGQGSRAGIYRKQIGEKGKKQWFV